MTRPETEALTTAHFTACNGWALAVVQAAFHQQRAKETMELIDTVMGVE